MNQGGAATIDRGQSFLPFSKTWLDSDLRLTSTQGIAWDNDVAPASIFFSSWCAPLMATYPVQRRTPFVVFANQESQHSLISNAGVLGHFEMSCRALPTEMLGSSHLLDFHSQSHFLEVKESRQTFYCPPVVVTDNSDDSVLLSIRRLFANHASVKSMFTQRYRAELHFHILLSVDILTREMLDELLDIEFVGRSYFRDAFFDFSYYPVGANGLDLPVEANLIKIILK